jgi:hypothetical protein
MNKNPILYLMRKGFFFLLVLFSTAASAQLTYQQVLVEYDSAWTFQHLQLIPIRFKGSGAGLMGFLGDPKGGYLNLGVGMKSGKVKVKEFISKGDADVHILSIKNNSNQTILIRAGELIGGGKQDRMVGETVLIPPSKEERYINVYCVEEGRWEKKARPFSYSGSADMDLRKIMDLTQRQVDIWKEIQNSFKLQNKNSTSWPYLQLDREALKTDSLYTAFFKQKMAQTDSTFAGFLAISGNKILGTEIFVTNSLFNNAWESMLAMFVRTAITKGGQPTVTKKEQMVFMDAVLENETSQKKTVQLHGKTYKFENQLIGLIVYGF